MRDETHSVIRSVSECACLSIEPSNNHFPELPQLATVLTAFKTMDLVVHLVSRVRFHHSPSALVLKVQFSPRDTDVSHLAPVFTPTIPDDPVRISTIVGTPSNYRNHMINILTSVGGHTGRVVENWARIDAARDGPAVVNFLLHRVEARDRSKV